MGEPITLYTPEGDTVTVYGKNQQAAWEAQGFTLTPPEPVEVEPEPEQPKPKAKAVKRNTRAS